MANVNELKQLDIEQKQTQKLSKKINKKINIKSDTEITIDKSGKYEINITSDSKLKLNIKSKKIVSQITIKLSPKINAKILEKCNSKESFIDKQIQLDKSSTLNYSQIISACRSNKTLAKLKQNSNYNLVSAYSIDKQSSYIFNAAQHIEKNSKSNLEVNGTSSGGSRVVNDGLINIKQKAEKSEGYQKLNNLILDDQSTILSEPILEIDNNNVKCSHGASISQIKDEILFYIQSRGISKENAVKLITDGFENKAVQFFEKQSSSFFA